MDQGSNLLNKHYSKKVGSNFLQRKLILYHKNPFTNFPCKGIYIYIYIYIYSGITWAGMEE